MKYLITCICLALVVAAESALAELPPGAYENLKTNATDVLMVKITKVEMQKGQGVFQDIVYTAEVLKVDRSKSGRKVGDTIQISSYRLRSPSFEGPRIPSLLKTGWTGKAYLNAAKGNAGHRLAAYGESFEAEKKKKK